MGMKDAIVGAAVGAVLSAGITAGGILYQQHDQNIDKQHDVQRAALTAEIAAWEQIQQKTLKLLSAVENLPLDRIANSRSGISPSPTSSDAYSALVTAERELLLAADPVRGDQAVSDFLGKVQAIAIVPVLSDKMVADSADLFGSDVDKFVEYTLQRAAARRAELSHL